MSDDVRFEKLDDTDIIAVEFAAAMLTGKPPEVIEHMAPQLANAAYVMADAFMAARAKRER